MKKSGLGNLYTKTYTLLCGKHPRVRPWHFQWLGSVFITRELKKTLPELHGSVLDVGCGEKPYAALLINATRHIGIDLTDNPEVDHVIKPQEPWPFDDNSFDNVFSTQVLEHTEDYDFVISETKRVLKPGGHILFSLPFLYNEHGAPEDYQRFTIHKARSLFNNFELIHVSIQGGIGSTIITLLLNWIDATQNLNYATRLIKAAMLPLALPLNLVLNLGAYLFDHLDRTDSFYTSVIILGHAVYAPGSEPA